jgi:Bacteriophage HK97-gp10, putative tail-component
MANVDIDFTGIRHLYNWVEGFGDQYDNFNHRFASKTGLKLLRYTKKATPVGDYENDVAFWARKSVNDPSKGIGLVELDGAGAGMSGGTLRRSWELSPVVKRGNDYDITVFNDIEYAPYVEHGHRVKAFNSDKVVGWFEGRHMAKDSVKNVQQKLPVDYSREFIDFIRLIGGL